MEKLIGRQTYTTPDGSSVEVLEYQEQRPAGHQGDPKATIPGMKRRVTEDGEPVGLVDGQLCILATFEPLTPVDG